MVAPSATPGDSVSVTVRVATVGLETVWPATENAAASGADVVARSSSNVIVSVAPSTVALLGAAGAVYVAVSGPNDSTWFPVSSCKPPVEGLV